MLNTPYTINLNNEIVQAKKELRKAEALIKKLNVPESLYPFLTSLSTSGLRFEKYPFKTGYGLSLYHYQDGDPYKVPTVSNYQGTENGYDRWLYSIQDNRLMLGVSQGQLKVPIWNAISPEYLFWVDIHNDHLFILPEFIEPALKQYEAWLDKARTEAKEIIKNKRRAELEAELSKISD